MPVPRNRQGCRGQDTRRGGPEAATGRGGGRRSTRRLASGVVVAASAADTADRPLHPVDLHRRRGGAQREPRVASGHLHRWGQDLFHRFFEAAWPGPAYVSRAGGEVVHIPSPVERSQLLGLSPDGGRLLVRDWPNPLQTEGALWVVPTSGSAPKRLGDVMAQDAAWSPDGQSLVYARGEELYLSSSDGGQARRLATTPGRAHWIRWSPDGRHLRFTLIDTKGHRRSLWEVSADGTDLHVLPFQWGDERPQECCGEWSRDGRHFVFTAVHEQGAGLWMVDETGAVFRGRSWKPRRLTSDSFASVAAIPSVDGKAAVRRRSAWHCSGASVRSPLAAACRVSIPKRRHISFLSGWPVASVRGVPRNKGNLETKPARRQPGPGAHGCSMEIWTPRWSPDGTQIAFTGKRPGQPYKAISFPGTGACPSKCWRAIATRSTWSGRRTAGR